MSSKRVSENYVPGQEVRNRFYFEQQGPPQVKKNRREKDEDEEQDNPEAEYQGDLELQDDGD